MNAAGEASLRLEGLADGNRVRRPRLLIPRGAVAGSGLPVSSADPDRRDPERLTSRDPAPRARPHTKGHESGG